MRPDMRETTFRSNLDIVDKVNHAFYIKQLVEA